MNKSAGHGDRYHRSRQKVALVVAAGLLMGMGAGCASAVKLRTDKPSYSAGDSALLTLQNQGLSPVDYNLCKATLERQTRSGWEEVPLPEPNTCASTMEQLKVNRDDSYRLHLAEELPAGEYRFVTVVKRRGGEREVQSLSFSLN